jgi:hypothetical protein
VTHLPQLAAHRLQLRPRTGQLAAQQGDGGGVLAALVQDLGLCCGESGLPVRPHLLRRLQLRHQHRPVTLQVCDALCELFGLHA